MMENNCAYIDGSYNPENGKCAYGVILFNQAGVRHYYHGLVLDPDMVKMRNVSGEIQGAIVAVGSALGLGMLGLTLYYDYEGIEKWVTGEWRANNEYTREYAKYMRQMMAGLDIRFEHVKSHSGVYWNEKADWLAKTEVGLIQ